jgi:hypothetical protein
VERGRKQHALLHRDRDALAAAGLGGLLRRERVLREHLDARPGLEHGRRTDEHRPECGRRAAALQRGRRGQLRLEAVDLRTEEVAGDADVEAADERLAALLLAWRGGGRRAGGGRGRGVGPGSGSGRSGEGALTGLMH